MNTYENEQAFTDRYGNSLVGMIARSFGCQHFERVTDRETQIQGVDYWIWKDQTPGRRCIKTPIDLKIDYYENENFAFELDQQYSGVGEKSWIEHNGNIYVAYVKIALRQVWIYKTEDLQKFMNTDCFKCRKVFETNRTVNGKAGHFKNFRLDELPVHHTIDVSFFYNPFEADNLLKTKPSMSDSKLYN